MDRQDDNSPTRPPDASPKKSVTNAKKPPIELSGTGSWLPPKPKPTQVPENLPPYYPSNLKPQTRLILCEAIRKFPEQTQALELCQYVVSELTPHFSAAVQSKTPRADQVEDIMNDLLHYILVSNCDNSEERFRLKQKVRRSDEWLKLAREMAIAGRTEERPGSGTVQVSARNLAEPGINRRGYRAEIQQWMQRENLENLEQARCRLGVSESTLKSIMSDKGKLRYGRETLERILVKIGCNKG